MAIHIRVAESLQEYLVNRNLEALQDLITLLQAEAADPSMQEAVLTVPMKKSDIERAIFENDYIKLPVAAVDTGGIRVYEDKLIRVLCSDQPDDSCMILKVGHLDNEVIKLFPIGGFEG